MDNCQSTLFPDLFKTKTCIKCKVEKPVEDYYAQGNRCKKCINAYNMGRYYAGGEAERRKRSEQSRQWGANNRDKLLATKRRYREKNRVALREKSKRWQKENREKSRQIIRRRRARKARVPAGYKPSTTEILARQNGKCAYCKATSPEQLHLDHVVPISSGGADCEYNIVAACASCNQSKGNRDVSEWMRSKGLSK